MSEKVLVTGAGGFIGGHLIASLLEQGHDVRAVDVKEPDDWYQLHEDADSRRGDVSEPEACREAMRGVDAVYNLAADMGGMGFIEKQQGAVHAVGADQHAPADGRPRGAASSATSSRRRPACTRPTSRRSPT